VNFFRPFRAAPLDRKKLTAHPRTAAPGRAWLARAAKVLKRVMAVPVRTEQQVPAKRQNRGSGNSTDDGVLKAKAY